MNMALKMVASFMETKNIRCQISEDGTNMRVAFKADNKGSMDIIVVFDEGNDSVGLRSFDFCSFPAEKKPVMYEICSKMNKDYRWVKFYVDESDNTITLADDAVIDLETCGEEVYELIGRMLTIGDEAYPAFMKNVWG